MPNKSEIKKWSVLLILNGRIDYSFPSEGETPEAAYKNIFPYVEEILRSGEYEYRVEPFPERLHVRARHILSFQVPGPKDENDYPVEVHEYYGGIGFSYQPTLETSEHLEQMAPVTIVQKIAEIANDILQAFEVKPQAFVIGIRESEGIGESGYGGKTMVDQNKVVYIELELFDHSLQDVDFWEGMLWHEAIHAKYILDERWPSTWPFYERDAGPLWALNDLVHFSIDGWLEKNDKPRIIFNEPNADTKSIRLDQLRRGLQKEGYIIDESVLTKIANDLWGRETDIWEIWKIMQQLGLTIPETTPLGLYLRQGKKGRKGKGDGEQPDNH